MTWRALALFTRPCEEEGADRYKSFEGFQIDGAMMAAAGPQCKFMHCLPAGAYTRSLFNST
jgi:ornithine carbamoyltransferase